MTTLFHYCSTATFFSMTSSKALWLSSVRQSNDSTEGQVVSQAIARLSKERGHTDELTTFLLSAANDLESLYDGLGFCLSEEGDLLSQWRGYAKDGTGISVGFDRKYLDLLVAESQGKELDLELNRVEYEPHAQDALVLPAFEEVVRIVDTDEDFQMTRHASEEDSPERKRIRTLSQRVASLKMLLAAMNAFSAVFSLKHTAFAEEREWRLLHLHSGHPDLCGFRATGTQLVPYKVCDLPDLGCAPIVQVILGPRHTTPTHVMESYLAQSGFTSVVVSRSAAPYR